MSTTLTDYTQAAQEQTLKAIRESQQAVVEVVRTWATAVEKAIPETPAVPFANELPTPEQIVKTSFGFAEQLLKAQRDFAENLIAAVDRHQGIPWLSRQGWFAFLVDLFVLLVLVGVGYAVVNRVVVRPARVVIAAPKPELRS